MRLERLEKNFIKNGSLEFWQRLGAGVVTVNTSTAVAAYHADRVKYGTSGLSVKNFSIQRSAVVPSIQGFKIPFSYQFNCLTAMTPFGSDVTNPWQYVMEGRDYRDLHGRYAGLGFWVQLTAPAATFPVQLPIAFSNNANRSYVTSFQVNANNVPQFIPISILFQDAGAWNFDNNAALKITIGSSAGGTYQGPLNQWFEGANENFSFAGAFNIMSNNGNILRLSALQLFSLGNEANVVFNPSGQEFVRAGYDYSVEKRLCQRYFQKSYEINTNPGTSGNPPGYHYLLIGSNISGAGILKCHFQEEMRSSTPVIAIYSPATGAGGVNTAARVRYDSTTDRVPGVQVDGATGFVIGYSSSNNGGNNWPEGVEMEWHWTAEAEL